jgi:hypothetical protein
MFDYRFDKNTILLIVPSSLILYFWFWAHSQAMPSGLLDVFIALCLLFIVGMIMNMVFYFVSLRIYFCIMRHFKLVAFDKSKLLNITADVNSALIMNATFFHHLAIAILTCVVIAFVMAIQDKLIIGALFFVAIIADLICFAASYYFVKANEELKISR